MKDFVARGVELKNFLQNHEALEGKNLISYALDHPQTIENMILNEKKKPVKEEGLIELLVKKSDTARTKFFEDSGYIQGPSCVWLDIDQDNVIQCCIEKEEVRSAEYLLNMALEKSTEMHWIMLSRTLALVYDTHLAPIIPTSFMTALSAHPNRGSFEELLVNEKVLKKYSQTPLSFQMNLLGEKTIRES